MAPSRAALINFDDLVGGTSIASPTPVTTQYAAEGVVFSDPGGAMGAVLGTVVAVTGYSPPNVLFATQHQSDGAAGDLRLSFSVGTTSVALDAFQSAHHYLAESAYGPGNTLLGVVNFPPPGPYGVAQHNVITEASPISYLLLTSHPNGAPTKFDNFSVDNVSFGACIPESSTWAMMLLGFAALSFLGYRQIRKGQVATA